MKLENIGLISLFSLVLFSSCFANSDDENLLDKRQPNLSGVNNNENSQTAKNKVTSENKEVKDNSDLLLSLDHENDEIESKNINPDQVLDELLANENLKNSEFIETEQIEMVQKFDNKDNNSYQINNSSKEDTVRTNQKEQNASKGDKDYSQNYSKVPEIVKQNSIDNSLNQKTKIIIRPGVSEIIPISQGFINRIVTPFVHPEVVSSSFSSSSESCSEFCIRGNVVYINTNESIPLSMFISEKDDPEKAFSVTLIPKHIPSREISFSFPKGMYEEKQNLYREEQNFQEPTDYQLMLRNVLRSLALNEIPEGYSMHETSSNDHQPYCYQDGLSFSFNDPGMYFLGSQFIVYVGIVENKVSQFIEAQEISCFANNVVAISFWPKVLLEPHDKSEVYVIEKIPNKTSISNYRPNLLRK